MSDGFSEFSEFGFSQYFLSYEPDTDQDELNKCKIMEIGSDSPFLRDAITNHFTTLFYIYIYNRFGLSHQKLNHCRRSQQYILGPRKYIPKAATSLRIRLSDEAQLRIDEDFFYHNTVNRISIQGDEHAWQSSRTQVEVGPEAFKGNNGPFPEIEISNLFTVVIRTKAFSGKKKFVTTCLIMVVSNFTCLQVNSRLTYPIVMM